MVRKTTRSAMKSAGQSNTESPRGGRTKASSNQKRSPSKSDDSEDDTSVNLNKNISLTQADKASTDNESDTDSKKPLKKRTRSMAIKEPVQQSSSSTKSRWDKQHKTQTSKKDLKDTNEEVKEDQNLKGKSKNINNSNNDNVVDPETENENVQVTDESPSDAKDHEDQIKNGHESKETDSSKSNTGEADIISHENSSEQAKVLEAQSDPLELMQQTSSNIPSEEKTDDTAKTSENLNKSKDSNKEPSDVKEKKSSDRCSSQQSLEVKAEMQNKKDEENSKKIKLKRPSGDKHPSESDDKEKKTEENGTRKKITLKRLENKPVLSEETKQEENHDLLPKEQPQIEEWTSIYESKGRDVKKHEKSEEKPSRKRITLKRPTVEDKGLVYEKNVGNEGSKIEVSLDRSISLPEHGTERRKSIVESTTPDGKRRRSSAVERPTNKNDEKPPTPKKTTKIVKLVRNIPKETPEPPPPGEETLKKYRWGKSDHSRSNIKIVNLEDLKQVCPTIEFLKEEEVNLEIVVKEHKIPIKERRKTFTELEAEEMEKIEAELNAEPEEIEIKENIIAMNRKISIVDDTASKMKPPPSPARNPISEVLFLTNLVRPFTVKQLKELLERTGKIKDDGFWTDRIKSKCYVCYETSEEAEATRNALHGVNWPIGNGKKLMIDYATVEDLETAKNPPIAVKKEPSPEKENKKPVLMDNKDDISSKNTKREWHQEKDDHRRRRSRSRSKDRQRKHSRRSHTPDDYHGKKRKHEEPPLQKAMDDLFLKTKATPSIYWQPLSPEEIALKQQQRQVRLEENKRRLEEISRTAPRNTYRDRGRGDRSFRRH